jgi:hypothetical protein
MVDKQVYFSHPATGGAQTSLLSAAPYVLVRR